MTKKIFIPQPIAIESETFLNERGYEIYIGTGKTDKENLINDIKDADAMLLRGLKVDADVLEAAKKMKIIARHGAGYDNLDWKKANDLGIVTTYSPESTTISVAEYAITAMLTLAKQFPVFEKELRNDNFAYKYSNKGNEVTGKVLGIIGFGKIGKQVAFKAKEAFGMKVLTLNNRHGDIPDYVEAVDFNTLIEKSDYITLHVPANDSTLNLINKDVFDKMKKSAYLINASRGGVMNEKDLVDAIKNKEIAGAVVDVFETEPPSIDNELFELDNVILTPHIGSNTEECMMRIAMDCAEDIDRVLSDEKPKYPIGK